MNFVPILKVLRGLGLSDDEAYALIGKGQETLERYLRFRFSSWDEMIAAFEKAEQ
jgi:hypothetical protein